MGETPTYEFPYPELPELDNVPIDMQELALAVENTVSFQEATVAGKQSTSQKGQPDGYAPLDGNARLPSANQSDRLRSSTYPPSNDANLARDVGWYAMQPATLNGPGFWGGMLVTGLDPTSHRQTFYTHGTYGVWQRQGDGTSYSVWAPIIADDGKIHSGALPAVSGVDYIGNYNAGTAYKKGDVVRYNGVDYIAVNDSTGQTPPLAASALVPQPVMNGQWLKGSGGAAIWSPLTVADVPTLPATKTTGLVTADTGWTTMSLTSGSHYGAPYGPVQYRKLASGLVICQGLFTVATAGAQCFTFPAGYRPTVSRDLIFFCASSVAPIAETWRLDGNGSLRPNAGVGAGGWVSMANITFYADG